MKLAVAGTLDTITLSTELDAVEANYRHVLPTGSCTLANADDLSKVLGANRTTAVAAAALPVKPAPPAAKQGKGIFGKHFFKIRAQPLTAHDASLCHKY